MFSKVNLFSLLLVFVAVSFAKVSYAELTIDPSGNVGIGTTSPTRKLDVNGDIRLSGGEVNSNANIWFTTGAAIEDKPGSGGLYLSKQYGQIHFRSGTGNPIRMSIGTDGNVGIGTTSPGAKLDINKSAGVSAQIGTSNNGHYFASQSDVGIDGFEIYQLHGANTNRNSLAVYDNRTGSKSAAFVVRGDGNVGIGTTAPSYKLHVNGTAYATGGAGALSDIRHKKNVNPISNGALNIIDNLRPVTYEWKNPVDTGMEGTQIGFIAQEVAEILPSVVMTQDDTVKTKALKYNEFIPVLVKAIQELKTENDNTKEMVKTIKAENKTLNAENNQLRKALTSLTDRQTAIESMLLTMSLNLPKDKLVMK